MNKILKKRHYIIMGIIVLFTFAVLALGGSKNAVLSSDGVLDMFIPSYRTLRLEHAFFSQDTYVNISGMMARDTLYSELKFMSLPFMIMPAYAAYVFLYFSKLFIATTGVYALGKSSFKEDYKKYESLLLLIGFAYGLINVFPAYWISFASIPWLIYIVKNLANKVDPKLIILTVIYPFFSDMLHFGVFIVPIVLVYFICYSIRHKRFAYGLLIGDVLLALMYALTEYRYIRLINESSLGIFYDVSEWSELTWDRALQTFDRLYISYPYMQKMVPYLSIIVAVVCFILMKQMYDKKEGLVLFADAIIVGLMLAILFTDTKYNDILHTVTRNDESVTFDEYYNTNLYSDMLKDIDYKGQWMMTYGIDEGILQYSGIKTLEGVVDIPQSISEELYREKIAKIFGEPTYISDESVSLSIDTNSLKKFLGRYLVSAYDIVNAKENGFALVNKYTDDLYGQNIYLYITESRYVDKEMSDIPFEERTELTYNREDLDAYIEEANLLIKEANEYKELHPDLSDKEILENLSEAKISDLYEKMKEYMEIQYTLASVYEIRFSADVTRDEYREKLEEVETDFEVDSDKFNSTLRDLCKTPYSVYFDDIYGYGFAKSISDYEEKTDEEIERNIRINELENDYSQKIGEVYHFEYNGEDWTEEKLNEEWETLDEEAADEIDCGIMKAKADVIGPIYLELVKLRNEIAIEEDYDNFTDYVYECHFNRDFDSKDAKKFCKEVRDKFPLYYGGIASVHSQYDEPDLSDLLIDDRQVWDKLYPEYVKIDAELGDSLKHLLDCNLYDLKENKNKADKGYTCPLYTYGDGYIFDSPYGTISDLYTYSHEFGHFNNMTRYDEDFIESTSSMDVAEIDSNGLEMLMASRYDELFGEDFEFLELDEVKKLFTSILSACVVADFEIYVYDNPDSTLEEFARYYGECLDKYGYYSDGEDYSWLDIGHVFESPNYYISYATSAIAALQIYALSYEDYDLAVEKYLEITTLPTSCMYCNALSVVGLDNPFERGNVNKTFRDIYNIYMGKRK